VADNISATNAVRRSLVRLRDFGRRPAWAEAFMATKAKYQLGMASRTVPLMTSGTLSDMASLHAAKRQSVNAHKTHAANTSSAPATMNERAISASPALSGSAARLHELTQAPNVRLATRAL
jgi:hypothetical protein